MAPYSLLIVASHPVQYHAPLYRTISDSASFDVKVIYLSDAGVKPTYIHDLSSTVAWDGALLAGYRSEVLRSVGSSQRCGHGLLSMGFKLASAVACEHYDCVLIQGYNSAVNWATLFAAKMGGKKTVWRGEACRGKPRRLSECVWLRKWLVKRFLGLCDAVLYSCEGNLAYLRDLSVPATKVFPFPCAVDNERMEESCRQYLPQRPMTRKALGIPEDDLVVVCCGSLIERKRPSDLIEAVARVRGRGPWLLWMGDGPLRGKMAELARARGVRMSITGFVNQNEIGKFYAAGDVFALVSEYDASPKALNEAMNFPMALVISDAIGTARDFVKGGTKRGRNGFVVSVGDVDGIAGCLSELSEDRALCSRMGRSSQEIIKAYSFDADVGGLVEACRSVVKV